MHLPPGSAVAPLCVPTVGNMRSLPALGLHPLHPVMEVGPALGGRWQELSAGRAAARRVQSRVLRLPGLAAQPASQTPGRGAGQPAHSGPPAHPLTLSWLHGDSPQPAESSWPARGSHVAAAVAPGKVTGSCGAGDWVPSFSLRDA